MDDSTAPGAVGTVEFLGEGNDGDPIAEGAGDGELWMTGAGVIPAGAVPAGDPMRSGNVADDGGLAAK